MSVTVVLWMSFTVALEIGVEIAVRVIAVAMIVVAVRAIAEVMVMNAVVTMIAVAILTVVTKTVGARVGMMTAWTTVGARVVMLTAWTVEMMTVVFLFHQSLVRVEMILEMALLYGEVASRLQVVSRLPSLRDL